MNNNKLQPKLRFPEFVKDGEWSTDILENLSNVVRGGSPRPIEDFLTNREDGLNWLKIGDVNSESKYIVSTTEKILKQAESKTRIVKPGDLILSNSMSFGRPFILDVECGIHDGWIAISQINKEKTNEEYLYYFISSDFAQKYFNVYAAGAAVKNLNAEIIKKLPIFYPSDKKEQQKIADCLSSLDELISLQEEKILALEEHKKGLIQNLFPQQGETVPKIRFREFKNDGDWQKKKIIDTADKKIKWSFTGGPFGSNLKASDYTSDGYRIIQLQNIGDGEFNDTSKIYTSLEKADELISCNIYSGEIIFSKMGDPVGRTCIIPENLERSVMASDGIRLVVDEHKFSKYFIFYLINSQPIREKIEKKSTGSTRKRIGLDELKNIEILVPKNIKEQEKIANCLSSINDSIAEESNKILQFKTHKKGLLDGLFPKIES
ncbi:restriction endonuclease subunit S [Chryseobacterium sp. S0630]|uniref:restriction endonuclease subunit S n=1 Tax=Chryseobacterium sp. S0630 TaxID=2957803 RepID=UPI00209C9FAC|nr:restriction endonuclease subunit S [Chryseobacterium sp. S0630]MCP1299199.1 restriction endonuclease subunit S [Chryseobacterium sp. S0630]